MGLNDPCRAEDTIVLGGAMLSVARSYAFGRPELCFRLPGAILSAKHCHSPSGMKVSADFCRRRAQPRSVYAASIRLGLIAHRNEVGVDHGDDVWRKELMYEKRLESVMADRTVGIAVVELRPVGRSQTVDGRLATFTYVKRFHCYLRQEDRYEQPAEQDPTCLMRYLSHFPFIEWTNIVRLF